MCSGTGHIHVQVQDQLASMIKALLVMKADLLRDCFGVDVSPEGRLLSLPMLIESYCPDLTYLPQFFLALAGEVDWLDETRAFHDLATVCLSELLRLHKS